jgi:cyanophycin synthetase
VLQLRRLATYHGPNPFAADPMLVADLIFDPALTSRDADLVASSRAAIEGSGAGSAARGVLHATQGVERIADFVLRAAMAMTCDAEQSLRVASTREVSPGTHRLWLGFFDAALAEQALVAFSGLVAELATRPVQPDKLRDVLVSLDNWRMRVCPDYESGILIAACRADDLPWMPAWGRDNHWQYGWGLRSRVMFQSSSHKDGYLGGQAIADKRASKQLFVTLGLPVAPDALLRAPEDIPAAIEKVGFPAVVKPIDRGSGNGVSAVLENEQQVRDAYEDARQFSSAPIMYERYVPGDEHRIMFIDYKLVTVACRRPPHVTGDGISTVRQLVDALNMERTLDISSDANLLNAVPIDRHVAVHLARQGLTFDSVPAKGSVVSLRMNSNVSTGGTFEAYPLERLNPGIRAALESLAETLNIGALGMDYVTTDLGKGWHESGGVFLEGNLTPSLSAMMAWGHSSLDGARAFLGKGLGRVPTTLIVTREDRAGEAFAALSAQAMQPGRGLASHDAALLGGCALAIAEAHPWAGLRAVLRHRSAESLVAVASSTRLQQSGLPLDRFDRIVLADPDLSEAWRSVLAKNSVAPLEMVEPGGVTAALLDEAQPA